MALAGKDIRKFRNSLGISQKRFGEELGFGKNSQIQVCQIENGKRKVTERLEKMVLKWKENELLKRELELQAEGE